MFRYPVGCLLTADARADSIILLRYGRALTPVAGSRIGDGGLVPGSSGTGCRLRSDRPGGEGGQALRAGARRGSSRVTAATMTSSTASIVIVTSIEETNVPRPGSAPSAP